MQFRDILLMFAGFFPPPFQALILMLCTSSLLYFLKPKESEDSVDDFGSIPGTFYLSILMLTGQVREKARLT